MDCRLRGNDDGDKSGIYGANLDLAQPAPNVHMQQFPLEQLSCERGMRSVFHEDQLQFSSAITSVAGSVREAPSNRHLYSPLILGVVDALLHFQNSRGDHAKREDDKAPARIAVALKETRIQEMALPPI